MIPRFCMAFTLLLGQLQGGDLYSIILCDTIAYNINETIEADLVNFRNEVSRIQSYTDLNLIETVFEGGELIPSDIFAYINGLQFNPDDVVIFYFSGHGYRTPSKGDNPWPNLYFTLVDEGIDFFYVSDLLSEKAPGLLLTMCDCCNNFIPDNVAPDVVDKELFPKISNSLIRQNYQKLFLETKGVIMVRSSDVGEYSWCNSKGAIFTVAFLDCLQSNTRSSRNCSWDHIFSNTKAKVLKLQTPVYELLIE